VPGLGEDNHCTVTTASPAARATPRLYRRTRGRVIGGVAGGLADHLRISVWAVRIAFVLACAAAGLGVVVYAAFWIVLPTPPDDPHRSRIPIWLENLVAGAAAVGALVAISTTMVLGRVLIPAMLACLGVALIWRQVTETQRQRLPRFSAGSFGSGPIGRIRVLCGAALVVVGGALVLARADFSAVRDGLLAIIVTLVGVALITGPWWIGMVTDLNTERRERIRSQERAELAASLHDSVLQTLALIQRNADSPREVARLARGQERRLRTILYGAQPDSGRLSNVLAEAAAEVEDQYGVEVEVVVVGDAELTAPLAAVVGASREALVNAAKHAGVATVSLYAEVEAAAYVSYVKDRGVGFVLDNVADDRQGVRGSIIARVERYGGTVVLRSRIGEGTEVEIRMPRT
jgi:signal transduction histidine kinase